MNANSSLVRRLAASLLAVLILSAAPAAADEPVVLRVGDRKRSPARRRAMAVQNTPKAPIQRAFLAAYALWPGHAATPAGTRAFVDLLQRRLASERI